MSCQKDLHSVYIDDEMPENFVSEYENQVKQNPKSSAELEKMMKIHELLNFDAESESSKIDDEFVQKSFERLQNKMRFTQNVQFAEPKRNISSFVKLPLSFAAAAAVFAVIFVPLSKNSSNENIAIEAIKHTQLQPIAEAEVQIDGNIESEKLPEVFASEKVDLKSSNSNISNQKTVKASAMVSNRSRKFSSNMTSVDVFRPKFSEEYGQNQDFQK